MAPLTPDVPLGAPEAMSNPNAPLTSEVPSATEVSSTSAEVMSTTPMPQSTSQTPSTSKAPPTPEVRVPQNGQIQSNLSQQDLTNIESNLEVTTDMLERKLQALKEMSQDVKRLKMLKGQTPLFMRHDMNTLQDKQNQEIELLQQKILKAIEAEEDTEVVVIQFLDFANLEEYSCHVA